VSRVISALSKLKDFIFSSPKALSRIARKIIISICWSILSSFERPATTYSSNLPDLCPTDDAEGVNEYIDTLNEMLINRKKSIREIAITSPYSGGKSSLLNTYVRRSPFFKFTSISLASFKDLSQTVHDKQHTQNDDGSTVGDGTEKESTETLNKLEKSIVQQLLYRTDSEKTPNSRFRRIFPLPASYYQAISTAAAFALFVTIVTSMVYLPHYSLEKLHDSVSSNPDFSNINLWIFSYLLSLTILVFKDLYKNLSNVNIAKINPVKGELAFEQKNKDSIFNIYLDEIIYFFASQKSDIVIFEDLDRFENTEIFIKLKELNKLVNDSSDVKQEVRFIYALRDDVFKGTDRTKFFDVIIPIIPITSRGNSYPQLKDMIEDAGFIKDIDDSFLRSVSVYVLDMRMLKNIVVEFSIYKNTLIRSLEYLTTTKLFAFIVYKNVYSDDFAKLHEGKGDLFEFLRGLALLKETQEESIKGKISDLNQRLVNSDNELLDCLEELNSGFVLKLLAKHPFSNGVCNIFEHPIHTVCQPKVFDKLLADDRHITYQSSSNTRQHNASFSFKSFMNEVGPDYAQRKQRLLDKVKSRKEVIHTQIEQQKKELALIRELSISSLIKKAPRDEIFKKISDKNLLILLLERGYIDQNYEECISHFREGHMTLSDMAFIRQVQTGTTIAPFQKIDNFDECLKYLSYEDYQKAAFLNYKLFDHILTSENPLPVSIYIEKYLAESSELVRFVKDGFENLSNKTSWIASITRHVKSYWLKVVSSPDLSKEDKQLLLIDSINALDKNNWEKNLDDSLSKLCSFINEDDSIINFLEEAQVDASKVFNAFRSLGVKFELLGHNKAGERLLNQVLDNQLFEVNVANISYIAGTLFNCNGDERKNFSSINSISNESFRKVISSEIEKIAEMISTGNLTLSDENDFVWLLNNEDISVDTRLKIIETCRVLVCDLNQIDNKDELLRHLANAERIFPNWENAYSLYQSTYIEGTLLERFLDKNYRELTHAGIENFKEEDIYFYSNMILHDPVSEDAFISYVKLFRHKYKEEQIELMSQSKLCFLIDNGYLDVCADVFEAIKVVDQNASIKYLIKNFNSFTHNDELKDGLITDSETFYSLLDTKELDDAQRKILIESRTSLIDANHNQESLIEAIGCKKIIQSKDTTSDSSPCIPLETLKVLIKESSDDIKKALIVTQLKHLSNEDVISLIKNINIDFTDAFKAKRSFKVNVSNVNMALIIGLKNRSLVSSFKELGAKHPPQKTNYIEVFTKRNLVT